MPGSIIVISGCSGAGKATVIEGVQATGRFPGLQPARSATSRKPRHFETNGVEYDFVSRETFEAMIEAGAFVEWTEFAGNYYGTPAATLNQSLDQGEIVLVEVEVNGAVAIRELFPDQTKLLFILPPNREVQRARLLARGEPIGSIERRLHESPTEEAISADLFDARVVNNFLERTVDEVVFFLEAWIEEARSGTALCIPIGR